MPAPSPPHLPNLPCALPLPSTQHLEKTGDIKGALKHYEQSGCSHIEVPRMYYELHMVEDLKQYISSKGENRDLTMWWARYCESLGDIDKAYR